MVVMKMNPKRRGQDGKYYLALFYQERGRLHFPVIE